MLFQVVAEDPDKARERAAQIERRLSRLIETGAPPAAVQIARTGAARTLTISERPILVVTPEDANDRLTNVDTLAREWKRTIDNALARAAERRLTTWGRFAAGTQASIETGFSRVLESAIDVFQRLLAALLVLLFFWGLAALARRLMRLVFHRVVSDLTVENLIKQIAYYAIWAVGLVVATSALGFDPQALATGLGLTGLALGFALKDILSNFVSGILILTMRPFEIGDQIVIGQTEGGVERINLRATQIRTYDGRAVLVPNAELFTSRLTNNTESPMRRGVVEVPLGYQADLRNAVEIIRAATQKASGVLEEPLTSVRVRELKQDDIILESSFWTDSRRSDFVATSSNVRTAIVEAMRAASIGLPDPSARVVTVKGGPQAGGAAPDAAT
jgi:small-conductance mechanosensitive channel